MFSTDFPCFLAYFKLGQRYLCDPIVFSQASLKTKAVSSFSALPHFRYSQGPCGRCTIYYKAELQCLGRMVFVTPLPSSKFPTRRFSGQTEEEIARGKQNCPLKTLSVPCSPLIAGGGL
uniref:Secreted protein n=1 Tax=Steinernema glaseri TaxID=37863 RepID=A0A1I8AQH7_9BILA